jgi:hypothetical protein
MFPVMVRCHEKKRASTQMELSNGKRRKEGDSSSVLDGLDTREPKHRRGEEHRAGALEPGSSPLSNSVE